MSAPPSPGNPSSIDRERLVGRMQRYLRFDTSNPPGPAEKPDAPWLDWLVQTYLEPHQIPWERYEHHLLLTRPLLLSFLSRHPVTDALTRNTVTCTELSAGQGHNVRPGEARASLNARLMPDEPAEEVLRRYRALIADLDVELSLVSAEPAVPVAPRDTYEYRILERVLQEAYPDLAVASMVCPGATESRFFARLGCRSTGSCRW